MKSMKMSKILELRKGGESSFVVSGGRGPDGALGQVPLIIVPPMHYITIPIHYIML